MLREVGPTTIIERSVSNEENKSNGVVVFESSQPEPSGFDLLKQFVNEAAKRDVHRRVPRNSWQTKIKWANQWNILGTYLYTEASQNEIGTIYHVKGERVRQVVKRSAELLYNASPKELKEKYDFNTFTYKKPPTERNSINISRANGGALETILTLAKEGKSVQEIRSVLSRPIDTHVRRRAEELGIVIEYQKPAFSAKFKNKIARLKDVSISYEEKVSILQTISRGYYKTHRYEPDAPFIALSELLTECGIVKKKNKLTTISNLLNASGIATHLIEDIHGNNVMRYGLIARIDRDRAVEVLRTISDLN